MHRPVQWVFSCGVWLQSLWALMLGEADTPGMVSWISCHAMPCHAMPCQEQHHILPSVAVQAGGTIRETETEVLVASIGGGMQVGRLAIPYLGDRACFRVHAMPCRAACETHGMPCWHAACDAMPCHGTHASGNSSPMSVPCTPHAISGLASPNPTRLSSLPHRAAAPHAPGGPAVGSGHSCRVWLQGEP